MIHYINDTTKEVYGYKAENTRLMTSEEFEALKNPQITIEDCRTAKLAEMRKECGDRIAAGFNSDSLGYECQYRNTENDQLAMQKAAMLDGGKIWRNETLTTHTKPQALIVYTESSSEIDRHKTTYDQRCIYINDPARTSEEINAVTWDSVE